MSHCYLFCCTFGQFCPHLLAVCPQNKEWDETAKKMRQEKSKKQKSFCKSFLFVFAVRYSTVNIIFNIEWSDDIFLVHFILKLSYGHFVVLLIWSCQPNKYEISKMAGLIKKYESTYPYLADKKLHISVVNYYNYWYLFYCYFINIFYLLFILIF